MALREYVNNLHKQLQIGKYVKFVGGFYSTDDLDLQKLIESNNAFGTSIHFRDSLEIMERRGREREEAAAAERAVERKRILAEIAKEEKEESERKATAKKNRQADADEQKRLDKTQSQARKAVKDAEKTAAEGQTPVE